MKAPKWRYADKPCQVYDLSPYSPEDYITQAKIDGFRVVLQTFPDGHVEAWSRSRKPLPVSDHILKAIADLKLPPHTWLDGEWVARRKATKGIPERIYLFGSFYWAGEWTGSMTELERWREVAALPLRDPLYLPACEEEDIHQFAESTRGDWLTEGVVLKHKEARLIGDLNSCKKNPLYLKWKWREGCGGDNVTFSQTS